jgi:hypothetical protein
MGVILIPVCQKCATRRKFGLDVCASHSKSQIDADGRIVRAKVQVVRETGRSLIFRELCLFTQLPPKWADLPSRHPDVAAFRQSAANCDASLDGGFLPKAATLISHSECRRGNGARGSRTMLGDDGNQMQADGNSFPVFILGWTIGAFGVWPARSDAMTIAQPFMAG